MKTNFLIQWRRFLVLILYFYQAFNQHEYTFTIKHGNKDKLTINSFSMFIWYFVIWKNLVLTKNLNRKVVFIVVIKTLTNILPWSPPSLLSTTPFTRFCVFSETKTTFLRFVLYRVTHKGWDFRDDCTKCSLSFPLGFPTHANLTCEQLRAL